MKQVKPWTYPSMVLVPLCTELAMAWQPQRVTKVPPGRLPWPLSTPLPVGNEKLRLPFLQAH